MTDELDKILAKIVGTPVEFVQYNHLVPETKQAIQAIIDRECKRARTQEVQAFASHLIGYDQVLDEKYILNTILEYEQDRLAELSNKENK
jgi:hypothetical protein